MLVDIWGRTREVYSHQRNSRSRLHLASLLSVQCCFAQPSSAIFLDVVQAFLHELTGIRLSLRAMTHKKDVVLWPISTVLFVVEFKLVEDVFPVIVHIDREPSAAASLTGSLAPSHHRCRLGSAVSHVSLEVGVVRDLVWLAVWVEEDDVHTDAFASESNELGCLLGIGRYVENDETGGHLVRVESGESRFELVVFGIERGRDLWSTRKFGLVRRSVLFLTNDTRVLIGGSGLDQVGTKKTLALLVLDKPEVKKGCTFHD